MCNSDDPTDDSRPLAKRTLYTELAEEVVRKRRSRPLSRPLLRRVRNSPGVSGDGAGAQYVAAFLQLGARQIPPNARDLQRRMILECRATVDRLVKTGDRCAIALVLLDLTDQDLRALSRAIVLLSDAPVLPRQPIRRRDTGPPTPRHVATPIVANAPPGRPAFAPEYERAERSAA